MSIPHHFRHAIIVFFSCPAGGRTTSWTFHQYKVDIVNVLTQYLPVCTFSRYGVTVALILSLVSGHLMNLSVILILLLPLFWASPTPE